MKSQIKLFLFLFIVSSMMMHSQEYKLHKANKKYDQLAYIDATKVYLEVANSGFKSVELFKKLGDTYYFNANYVDAARWYNELFNLTETLKPIYFLRFSQSLKSNGKNEQAIHWFNKYALQVDLSNNEFTNAEDYLQIIDENSNRYTLKPSGINSGGIEFGAGLTDKETYTYKKIIFASSNQEKPNSRTKISQWSGLPFLDLYQATINEDGKISDAIKLEGDVNTKFHESSAVITKDGKTIYFTRNNTTPIAKRSKKQKQHLKIYRAHLVDHKWVEVEDLSINGDNYSTAHPALNTEEDKLYFASDMIQTLGLTDIFMATINKDGSMGKPTNLGEKINTKGRESFPFVSADNELYFSSDGHFGLGGYDVFYVKMKGDGYEGSLLNLGKPINSSFDDFAFAIYNHKGFVSSNRATGIGYDDLYSFIDTKDIKDLSISKIFGAVIDKETKQLLPNVSISIVNENNNVIATLLTDKNAYYEVNVKRALSYIIKATTAQYNGEDVFSKKNTKDREHNFELTKNINTIKQGDDLANLLNIIIYFDLDKVTIRPDAAVELQKIIAVLKQHPNIKLDIRSHTDSRASDAYNMALSQRRNNATVQYLITKGGIKASRLTGNGYGETQLINSCSKGMVCSEELHQANRRSEFIIIK